jgi:ribosomal protein L7/L12
MNKTKYVIDFKEYQHILTAITASANRNFRTVTAEILYQLNKLYIGDTYTITLKKFADGKKIQAIKFIREIRRDVLQSNNDGLKDCKEFIDSVCYYANNDYNTPMLFKKQILATNLQKDVVDTIIAIARTYEGLFLDLEISLN